MYYWLASSAADGTDDPALFAALWEKHRAAWDRFIDLTELAAERIEIPYEATTLPRYFSAAARPASRGGRWCTTTAATGQ